VELSRLEVVVEPAPAILERIRPGQSAEIRVAEVPDEAFEGTVKEVANGRVIVEFISGTPVVMPGLSAHVRVRVT
jgi:hypothetical protein